MVLLPIRLGKIHQLSNSNVPSGVGSGLVTQTFGTGRKHSCGIVKLFYTIPEHQLTYVSEWL